MTPKHLSRSGEHKVNRMKATNSPATLITSWLPNARPVGTSFLTKKLVAGAVCLLLLTVTVSLNIQAQTSEAHEGGVVGATQVNPQSTSTTLDLLSYIGYMVLTTFAITGGLIWTRWGLVGVQALWRFRKVLDATVREDFESREEVGSTKLAEGQ